MKSYEPTESETGQQVLKRVQGKLKSASQALAISIPEEETEVPVLALHQEQDKLPLYDDAEEAEYQQVKEGLTAKRLQPLIALIESKKQTYGTLTAACATAEVEIREAQEVFAAWKVAQEELLSQREANVAQREKYVSDRDARLIRQRGALGEARKQLKADQDAFDQGLLAYEQQRTRRRRELESLRVGIDGLQEKKAQLEAAYALTAQTQAEEVRAAQARLESTKDKQREVKAAIRQEEGRLLKRQEVASDREAALLARERSVDNREEELQTGERKLRSNRNALRSAIKEWKRKGANVPSEDI